MPARMVSRGIASLRVMESMARSRWCGGMGANPKPQLPSTTDVTPCQPPIVHHGSHRICAS